MEYEILFVIPVITGATGIVNKGQKMKTYQESIQQILYKKQPC
jgi:hypothetical protein